MLKRTATIGLGAASLLIAAFIFHQFGSDSNTRGGKGIGGQHQAVTGEKHMIRATEAPDSTHGQSGPSSLTGEQTRQAVMAGLARLERYLLESPPGMRPIPFSFDLQRKKSLRILIHAYPHIAYDHYLTLASNSSAAVEERILAVQALSIVAEQERLREKVRDSLIALARTAKGQLARETLHVLSSDWCSESLRALFAESAFGPDATARYASVEALGDYAFAQSSGMLDSLERNQAVSDEDLLFHIRVAKERVAILRSTDATTRLTSILGDLREDHEELSSWAIKIAKIQGRKDLLPALRSRVDRQYARDQDLAKEVGDNEPNRFQESYSGGSEVGTGHEEALLAIDALGGELKEVERARMRSFGYFLDYQKEAQERGLIR